MYNVNSDTRVTNFKIVGFYIGNAFIMRGLKRVIFCYTDVLVNCHEVVVVTEKQEC